MSGLPSYKIRTMVVYIGYKMSADGYPEVVHASYGSKPRKGEVTGRRILRRTSYS